MSNTARRWIAAARRCWRYCSSPSRSSCWSIELRARGNATLHRLGSGASRRGRPVALGHARIPALLFCALVVGFALVLPIAILAAWLLRSLGAGADLSGLAVAALHSLTLGFWTALIATACALPIAILLVRFPGSGARSVERLTYLGYALPGLVVALAFVAFGAGTPFYQTLVMLVAACVVRFLPEAISSTRAALLQVSPRLEEAARGLGRSQARRGRQRDGAPGPLRHPGRGGAGAADGDEGAAGHVAPQPDRLGHPGRRESGPPPTTPPTAKLRRPRCCSSPPPPCRCSCSLPATACGSTRRDRGLRRPRSTRSESTGRDAALPALRVRGLEKRYGDTEVLRGIDLDAERGEFLALLGPSGCGKTTALRLIAGFERPHAVDRDRWRQRLRRGPFGWPLDAARGAPGRHGLPGLRAFPPPQRGPQRRLRVAPQCRQPRGARGLGAGDSRACRSGRADAGPTLGGQQQRVALARALAPEPEVILLDEPFSNLDADLRASVREEVRQILREAGMTAVLVTHDQEEALSIADRVAVMLDGRIVQVGPPEELYHRPASRTIAEFIGDVQFLPGEASGRRAGTVLGDIPLHGAFDGPVDVMLRPEMLRLSPAGGSSIRGHAGDDRLPRILRPRPAADAASRQRSVAQGAAGRVRRISPRRSGAGQCPRRRAGLPARAVASRRSQTTIPAIFTRDDLRTGRTPHWRQAPSP